MAVHYTRISLSNVFPKLEAEVRLKIAHTLVQATGENPRSDSLVFKGTLESAVMYTIQLRESRLFLNSRGLKMFNTALFSILHNYKILISQFLSAHLQ